MNAYLCAWRGTYRRTYKMTIFKDKTITDNFIFGAVMQNPKLCKALLECILNIKNTGDKISRA